jgi:hypothetical protein
MDISICDICQLAFVEMAKNRYSKSGLGENLALEKQEAGQGQVE